MSSKVRILGRSVRRGTIIAVLMSLTLVTAAFAYSLFKPASFGGNIFDPGYVRIAAAVSDDNGTVEMAGGFDAGDNGMDPLGPVAGTTSAEMEADQSALVRSTENIQNCTVVQSGNDAVVTLTDAFADPVWTHCNVVLAMINKANRPMLYSGAVIEGTDQIVIVKTDPTSGPDRPCLAKDALVKLHVSLKAAPTAVAGTTWSSSTGTIKLSFTSVSACP